MFVSTGTGSPSNADLSQPTSGGEEAPSDCALERLVIYPMSQDYRAALAAAGVEVTYQVHRGGHLIPDFMNEFEALRAWGLFKPVLTDPTSWVNDTVATSGQLWNVGYRFARSAVEVVQFRRSGAWFSISAAGSAVTVRPTGGCMIHTATPARLRLPPRRCAAIRRERGAPFTR